MIELDKIYNENCMDTISKMDNWTIDLVITSPPYNMTKRKGGYGDTGRYDMYVDFKNEGDYIKDTIDLFNAFDRIVRSQGVVLYNFNYSIENPSLPYKLVSDIVRSTNWDVVDTICWKKRCGLPFPANKYRLSRNWEFVWVFVRKDRMNDFFIDKHISSTSDKTGQTYYNVWYNFIEAANNDAQTRKLNQATFSSEFVSKLLDMYCPEMGGVVYDPFFGTGTTAVACINNHKRPQWIGSEISTNQCNYAQERINKEIQIQKQSLF